MSCRVLSLSKISKLPLTISTAPTTIRTSASTTPGQSTASKFGHTDGSRPAKPRYSGRAPIAPSAFSPRSPHGAYGPVRTIGTPDSAAFRTWAVKASCVFSTGVRAANEVHSASSRSMALAAVPQSGSLKLGTRPYQAASAHSAPAEVPESDTRS